MEDATTASDLTDLSIRDLADRLASREPVPGGGSAAAITGALGAALVGMVSELSRGRPDAAEHEATILDLGRQAAADRADLLALAAADADAYQSVVTARRLPRDTDEQRAARREALDAAMRVAADVPLRTARRALGVLEAAAAAAPISNPNAVSDVGVAAQLASAAVRGAALNVRINLPFLPAGDTVRDGGTAELEALETRASALEASVVEAVRRRIEPS